MLHFDRKDKRTNTWSFIIYPGDSAPDNYLNIIASWHIPTLLSPVHSSEETPDDNREMKDHIHVLMYFGEGAKKSYSQVAVYRDALHGSEHDYVDNVSGLVRYFIHRDDPTKQQFDVSELLPFSGFDYLRYFDDRENDDKMYSWFEKCLLEHPNIVNLSQLLRYLDYCRYESEKRFLRRHSSYICRILDGNYQSMQGVTVADDIDNILLDVDKNKK